MKIIFSVCIQPLGTNQIPETRVTVKLFSEEYLQVSNV